MNRSIVAALALIICTVSSSALAQPYAPWVPVQQQPPPAQPYYYGPQQPPPAQPYYYGPQQPPPAPQYAPPAPQFVAAVEPAPTGDARRIAAMRAHLIIKGYGGANGTSTTEIEGDSEESDMPTTLGIAGQLNLPLHPNFSIGGLLGYRSWNNDTLDDQGIDASSMVDLDVVPTGRWVFSDTGTNLFAAMPMGLTFNWIDDSSFYDDVDVSSNLGFNVGLIGGIEIMFGRVVGLRIELGYHWHGASSEISGPGGSFDVDFSNSEVTSSLGLVFAI